MATFERTNEAFFLKDLLFANLPVGLSSHPYRLHDVLFRTLLSCLSSHCFATDSVWEYPSIGTDCEATVGWVTRLFGPSTPDGSSSELESILSASEFSAFWKTSFGIRQLQHNLDEQSVL